MRAAAHANNKFLPADGAPSDMAATSVLIWLAIGLFLAGLLVEEHAHRFSAAGYVAFGSYWVTRLPYYVTETHSFVKTILIVAALPLSLYLAYLVYVREIGELVTLGQAVAAMGLIYLPFAYWQPLNAALIEHTAHQEHRVLSLLGIDAELVTKDGLERKFVVANPETGETYATYIILACTGLGSMSIFGGLIAAIEAPLHRKMKAFAVSIPVIYVLNLGRNVFITTAYGHQWFTFLGDTVEGFMGEYPGYASFFWADKVISQTLSVVALVGITLLVIKVMPEVMHLLDDLLSVLEGDHASADDAV